uniref:Variant surface glycoprotein 1125.5242 n=1 Tax=Trypanosoma brucei TaxID=5691 RepID=A0A1J0RBU0_9TRYP|nr:variant surface glycoprotein 1125.5242 [Trypanosoma brucei]
MAANVRTKRKLDTVGGDALDIMEATFTDVQAMHNAEARLVFYCAKNIEGKDLTKSKILRGYIVKRLASSIQHLKTTDPAKLISRTANTAYITGRLDETLHFLAQSNESKTNACLVTTATNVAPVTNDQIGTVNCKRKLSPITKNQHERTKVTSTGFMGLCADTSEGNTTGHQAPSTATWKLLVAEHNQGYMVAEAAASKVEHASGYIEVPTTYAAINLKDMTTATAVTTSAKPIWTPASAATAGMPKRDTSHYKKDTTKIKYNNEAEKIAVMILTGKTDATEAKATSKIQKLFGDNQQSEIANLLAKVDDTDVPAGKAWLTERTKLGAIADTAALAALQSHYIL